jgi:hypothetical protein
MRLEPTKLGAFVLVRLIALSLGASACPGTIVVGERTPEADPLDGAIDHARDACANACGPDGDVDGSTDDGSTDDGSTDDGSTDDGSTDDGGSFDAGSLDAGSLDGSTD